MQLSKGNIVDDLLSWQEAYQKYILSLNYSEHTIYLYFRIVECFIEYSRQYVDEITIKTINRPYIINFLNFMNENIINIDKKGNKLKNSNGIAKTTKTLYLRALISFLNYISENNDDLMDFYTCFKNIKISGYSNADEKLEYLSIEEEQRLLDLLENSKKRKKSLDISFKKSFLIKLMLFGGLRVSEALKVKLADFTLNAAENLYYIKIPMAKGGKEQIGYIAANKIAEEIDYFLEHKNSNDYLFTTKTGLLMNRSNVFVMINSLYKQALIKKKGCHILRHTLAIRLTEQDVNLAIIKKILRHSNIATTTIYAKATSKGISQALNK